MSKPFYLFIKPRVTYVYVLSPPWLHRRTLRLDNNKLSGLPPGLLELTSLTSLGLRHNNFSNLPYRFGDLRCLQKLDMGQNMLKTLPPTMASFRGCS